MASRGQTELSVKRVLILGGSGMLGHKLCQVLGPTFETYATFRASPPKIAGVFDNIQPVEGATAAEFEEIRSLIRRIGPAYVINAIGIVKQRDEARQPIPSILINSLFPHQLAEACRERSTKLIHLSTDCVFSGNKGSYTEQDLPDPVDLYGRSKLLGEVDDGQSLTIRTSIIGRELRSAVGLVEWFLSQAGRHIRGYAHAIYSGLTTEALSHIIAHIIERGALHGIWHVSSEPITKYDLLLALNQAFGTRTTIERDENFRCDRSLVSDRFYRESGLSRPAWPDMIGALARDPTPYPRREVGPGH
jgi:dTDP-4-dehydrorhamnose reductase